MSVSITSIKMWLVGSVSHGHEPMWHLHVCRGRFSTINRRKLKGQLRNSHFVSNWSCIRILADPISQSHALRMWWFLPWLIHDPNIVKQLDVQKVLRIKKIFFVIGAIKYNSTQFDGGSYCIDCSIASSMLPALWWLWWGLGWKSPTFVVLASGETVLFLLQGP